MNLKEILFCVFVIDLTISIKYFWWQTTNIEALKERLWLFSKINLLKQRKREFLRRSVDGVGRRRNSLTLRIYSRNMQ